MEELNQQLAEAQGFAESKGIFAEAYQRHLANGGPAKLTGEAAIKALTDAMKKGQVKSSQVFPYVTEIMKERSASGIDDARNLASSQQERFMNQRQAFLQQFSDNGGEEGFRTFWKTMAQGMERITAMAPTLGRYFKGASEIVSGLFLGMGEIYDFATTGKLNSVTDWLQQNGIDVVKLREDISSMWTELKNQFTGLFGSSSIGERAIAVIKAIFDSGLIKEYLTYLKQTAMIYGNLAAAAQAAWNGNWGDAAGFLKAAGGSYIDRLGTNMAIGGATYDVLSAAVEGKDYQAPRFKNYAQESADFEKSPLAMYENLGFIKTRGMSFSEWKAAKSAELAETAKIMASRNPYSIAVGNSVPPEGLAYKPQSSATPFQAWSPGNLNIPSVADMSVNPAQSVVTDMAAALKNQQVKHNVDVKVNMSIDLKSDESTLGLKISDALNEQLGAKLAQQFQSAIVGAPNI